MWTEKRRYWFAGLAMILLGTTFVVAATGKLMAGSKAFELLAFPPFLPPALAKAIYISLPYIELAIGSLLILGLAVRFAANISLSLIICFAISNIILINQGIMECAGCFGLAGSFTPVSSLILDGVMAVMAITILLCYRGKFFNRTPWVFQAIPEGRECEYV